MVGPAAVGELPCLKDLVAVLFECFLIITLGYLSGRFKIISAQAKDLNSYLTTFALPMIIFLNIAQMEFHTINLSFLICMLSAKFLVFISVTLLTISISYPRNFGYAGALSILATQSNDFALGYPLIKSLYGEAKPEMKNYLSLMVPIQLLILNPLGIAMLEYNKSRKKTLSSRTNNKHQGNSNQDEYGKFDEKNLCNHLNNSRHSPINSISAPPNQPVIRSSTPLATTSNYNILQTQAKHLVGLGKLGNIADSSPSVKDDQQVSIRERSQSPAGLSFNCDNYDKVCNIKSNEAYCCDSTVDSNKPNRVAQLRGFARKNIKSITLVMPTGEPTGRAGSEESLDTSNDFNDEAINNDNSKSDTDFTFPPVNHIKYLAENNPSGCPDDYNRSVMVDLRGEESYATDPCAICLANQEIVDSPDSSMNKDVPKSRKVNLNFLKALATNPLIIASVVALLVNLIHGPELPKFVTRVSNTIAASFASPALFVVGISMYGKFDLLRKNPTDLLLSSVLVLTKILILPNLMRTLALIILPPYTPSEELSYLVDFSFLYGLLPTAPTACIIANQYEILTNVVSMSMLLSTILSAPFMLASSAIINPASVIKVSVIENIITETTKVSSVGTLVLALLTLYAFWKSKERMKYSSFVDIAELKGRSIINKIVSNPIHVFLFLMVTSQVMIGFGGLLWYFVDTSKLDPMFGSTLLETEPHMIDSMTQNFSQMIDKPTNNSTTTNEVVTDLKNLVSLVPSLSTSINQEQPLVESPLPVESTPLSGSDPLSGLDFLPPSPSPELIPTLEPLPEQAALVNDVTISPQLSSQNTDFGFNTLSTIQYISSSHGLLMVRFAILCLLTTILAMRFRGQPFAVKVSTLMVKVYLSFGVLLLVLLSFSFNELRHLPTEASLPSHTLSLWIRLIYNTVFLILAVPMFSLITRLYNEDKVIKRDKSLLASVNNEAGDKGLRPPHVSPAFIKSRFVTSSASLSSDTSSAITSNTNLDSTSSTVLNPLDVNNNPSPHSLNDSPVSTASDTKVACRTLKRSVSPLDTRVYDADFHPNQLRRSPASVDRQIMDTENIDHAQTHQYELDDPTNVGHKNPELKRKKRISISEFNKCSMLVVFVIINSTHNLTSIAQKLLHEEPIGTFRQVEVVNAALEFGQGLLTFLIYGTKGLINH